MLMLAVPATAFADQPTVSVKVNCVVVNSNGTFSALFDYTNTSSTQVLIKGGPDNSVTAPFNGTQPTSFSPGTVTDAFTATNAAAGSSVTWTLHGNNVATANAHSTPCNTTSMPQEGNGLGLVFALILAGLAGTFVVRRVVSRVAAQA